MCSEARGGSLRGSRKQSAPMIRLNGSGGASSGGWCLRVTLRHVGAICLRFRLQSVLATREWPRRRCRSLFTHWSSRLLFSAQIDNTCASTGHVNTPRHLTLWPPLVLASHSARPIARSLPTERSGVLSALATSAQYEFLLFTRRSFSYQKHICTVYYSIHCNYNVSVRLIDWFSPSQNLQQNSSTAAMEETQNRIQCRHSVTVMYSQVSRGTIRATQRRREMWVCNCRAHRRGAGSANTLRAPEGTRWRRAGGWSLSRDPLTRLLVLF